MRTHIENEKKLTSWSMWEEILNRVEVESELGRKDSAVTVSTVETFVSSGLSDLAATAADPEAGGAGAEAGERRDANQDVPCLKLFWWRHSARIVKTAAAVLGLACAVLLAVGWAVPVYGAKVAGLVLAVAAGVAVFMAGVLHFTTKDQREKALPYTGFNTFTPGVSWAKVFARQREGGGGVGDGNVVKTGHVF